MMSKHPHESGATRCARDRWARRRSRGFTLVELLIAMAAGLIVAAAAFLLSKNATQFFQHEARISSAQLSATLGMSRLAADLQRAGFMSSPNIRKDGVGRCGPTGSFPAGGLGVLAGIAIEKEGSVALNGGSGELAQSIANGFAPDSIVIGGSFSTTEQFPVQYLDPGNGSSQTVYLQKDNGAMARVRAAADAGGETIVEILKAGRILRVVDPTGKSMYGVIDDVVDGTDNVQVRLDQNVPLQQKLIDNDCGWSGLGIQMLANPVSRIRYEIRSLAGDPDFGPLVAPISAEATGDGGRTELTRTELDASGNEMSTELVAEYAVDLKFGITVATTGTTPNLTRYPIPLDDDRYLLAADLATNPAATPERIRAVQVRLSTRSRAPDRANDVDIGGDDGRRSRFNIVTDPPLPPPTFARMRTLYADVALPNLAGVTW
jgi:prepilin-type N-terminal cleavage/methylation domain-containing protein